MVPFLISSRIIPHCQYCLPVRAHSVLHLVRDGAHDGSMQPEGRIAHTPRRIGIHTHWRSDRTLLSETTKRCGQPSRAPSQFENRLRSVNSPVPLVNCFTAHNPGRYAEALKQPLQLNTMPYCGFICMSPSSSFNQPRPS